MRATCWEGKWAVEVQKVPDPSIVNPQDIIVRITNTTICGSDLHLYNGVVPGMRRGDILGHEPVGEVVDAGSAVEKHKAGDRVVVSSVVACGECYYCKHGLYALCDNSNPNGWLQEKIFTYPTAAIFGYSHLFGGLPGAQAEYLRVPYADVGTFRIPDGVTNEQALAISDAFPTGYMGADLCDLQGGETVAVWGAGPVGLLAMKSAWLLGAGRVIAIDSVPYRLRMAHDQCQAEMLDFEEVNITDTLREITGGRGPDCCIDACGMEAHGTNAFLDTYDTVKQALKLETDRGHIVRQMIRACRKGGTIVIMGAYGMFVDKFPLGAAFNKGLNFRMGLMHGPKYIPKLIEYTRQGRIDPSFCFTHRVELNDIAHAYDMFKNRTDGCVKVMVGIA
jgi:threonine dehydrogenase-like Zn-dependent dehydrogenase